MKMLECTFGFNWVKNAKHDFTKNRFIDVQEWARLSGRTKSNGRKMSLLHLMERVGLPLELRVIKSQGFDGLTQDEIGKVFLRDFHDNSKLTNKLLQYSAWDPIFNLLVLKEMARSRVHRLSPNAPELYKKTEMEIVKYFGYK